MAEPQLATLLKASMNSRLEALHTMMPGTVVSYDADAETATIRPAIVAKVPTVGGGLTSEALPDLQDVPIIFPRGGSAFIKWKLSEGDGVALIFAETDAGVWRDTGKQSEAGDNSRHSLSSPVAYAGFGTREKVASEGKVSGDEIVVEASEIHLGHGASELVALASIINSNFDSLKSWLDAHAHTAGAVGGLDWFASPGPWGP